MSMTAMVQKPRGRPPKSGMPRNKVGRIDWWAVREEAWRPGAWNAWRDKAIAFGMDPRLATQRGKLFFNKNLTEIEFEAANRWSDMLEKQDRMIYSMRRSPKPREAGYSRELGCRIRPLVPMPLQPRRCVKPSWDSRGSTAT